MIIKCISTITIYKIRDNQLLNGYTKIWKLYVIHNILLQTIIPSLTLIVCNYWVFIYNGQFSSTLSMYSSILVHGVSCIIIWIDFLISAEKMYYKSIIWPVLFGIMFTIWSIIFEIMNLQNQNGDEYIYEVYDWGESIEIPILFCFISMIIVIIISVFATYIKNVILIRATIQSLKRKEIMKDDSLELSKSMISSGDFKRQYI